jgi:hypothetical protein
MCPALATPGDYRVTLHRRLSHDGLLTHVGASKTPTSCDIYPVNEGPLPRGYPAHCIRMMDSLPSVTTETNVHVAPFDRPALAAATGAALHAAEPILREQLARYICGWLACKGPSEPPGDRDLLATLPTTLPHSFPSPCPTRAH